MHMPLGINDCLDGAKHNAPPGGELGILDFPGLLACRSCCPRSRQRLLIMGSHFLMGILHPGLQDFLVVFSAAPLAPNARWPVAAGSGWLATLVRVRSGIQLSPWPPSPWTA